MSAKTYTRDEMLTMFAAFLDTQAPAKAEAAAPAPVPAKTVRTKVLTRSTREAFVKQNPTFAGKSTREIREAIEAGAKVKGAWSLPTGIAKEKRAAAIAAAKQA
jgi:hypothetical protein